MKEGMKLFWEMEQYLEKCFNLYDVVAVAYYFIQKYDVIDITGEKEEIIENLIHNYTINNLVEGHIYAMQQIISQLSKLTSDNIITVNMLYELIKKIDKTINPHNEEYINSCSFKRYKCLNDNASTLQVYVFENSDQFVINKINGKMNDLLLKELRKKQIGHIDYFSFQNIIVCTSLDIENFDLEFIEIGLSNTITEKIIVQGNLKIVVCPFICNHIDDLMIMNYDKFGFWFEKSCGFGASKVYEERYFEILKKALHTEASLIVFPEMILNENICEKISYVIDNENINETKIIIAGTISRNCQNKCLVYNQFGELLFEQYKKQPFEFMKDSTGLKEKLIRNNKISILDIQYLGRIFIYICKDIMNIKLNNVLDRLDGNFLLLPTYSNSMDVYAKSGGIASQEQCFVVGANSCSALNQSNIVSSQFYLKHNLKEIAFITIPGKCKSGKRQSIDLPYKIDSNCQNCEKCCDLFMINMQFNDIIEYYSNELYSCKVNINRI